MAKKGIVAMAIIALALFGILSCFAIEATVYQTTTITFTALISAIVVGLVGLVIATIKYALSKDNNSCECRK